MSWVTTVTFIVLIIMQSYVLYPTSWKMAWRHIKGKLGV